MYFIHLRGSIYQIFQGFMNCKYEIFLKSSAFRESNVKLLKMAVAAMIASGVRQNCSY